MKINLVGPRLNCNYLCMLSFLIPDYSSQIGILFLHYCTNHGDTKCCLELSNTIAWVSSPYEQKREYKQYTALGMVTQVVTTTLI